MSHPPRQGVFHTPAGKKYVRRIHGLYQSSTPTSSITWNRDINAPLNMLAIFKHRQAHGCVPAAFSRDKKREDLPKSTSCRYSYAYNEATRGFRRWVTANMQN